MSPKIYSLIFFLGLFWFFCLYIGFRNQKKIITPLDYFIFGRQVPGWSLIAIVTCLGFSGWIFFFHPGLIFLNGLPFALTSLAVIAIPLMSILFSKRQWMLSKRYGFITPSEMLSEYFRSDIIRILVVMITIGFSIPFLAIQLYFGGMLINVLSDNLIGHGSASILIGSVMIVYLSVGGFRSLIYVDSILFLLMIFGIICIGFVTYDLVGGWDLLNESLSRISNIKDNFFNINENYSSYISIPGTIKAVNVLDENLSYNGIWTSSMILTFVFALTGLQLSPNMSMLTFATKEVDDLGTQQVWFSAFLIGFLLIFFITPIGVGGILLGGNEIVNQSGTNISNILPPNIYPDNYEKVVAHIINLIGDYSFIFFGVLAVCGIAVIQSTASVYLTTSAILTRDLIKRFFTKNLGNSHQIFISRIILMVIFILSLILSINAEGKVFALGSFSLSIACQMFVPLLALCYFPWFTKQGVSFGIVVGIIAVILTDSIGQSLWGELLAWNKWPLTIHSSVWGVFFNFVCSSVISFITQENKENNLKDKFHEFIKDHKNYSIARRSLKPSAWIITITWIFFALGPGILMGNQLFGQPKNVESWSFGMPSIWVWKIVFWFLGILLVWFLAIKMEMSTSSDKTIVSQTDDIGTGFRG